MAVQNNFTSIFGLEWDLKMMSWLLQQVASERRNIFESLMGAVKGCSLGSMSRALYDVGGEYRRNMQ